MLRHGYRIPFHSLPPRTTTPLNFGGYSSNSEKGKALAQEVSILLNKNAVELAPSTAGFFSRLFVVPKASGGFRPVLDLSVLNTYVSTTKFRMETIATVLTAVRRNDWMVTLDLKDAYFQVPVHPYSRRFLGFSWDDQTLQFRVLCFCLSTAPQVFTRMMAPVSAALHRQGIRLLRYLDDWLLLAPSEQDAHESARRLLALCARLGIAVNWEKSFLHPAQEITFLGVDIHSRTLRAFPTRARIDRFLALLDQFLEVRCPVAKQWMVLLGHMSSLTHLVPGSRRRMRSLQFCLAAGWSNQSRDEMQTVPWDRDCYEDLLWWSSLDNLLLGRPLFATSPSLALFTDASAEGWGASVLHLSVSGLWSQAERALHINLLELKAIHLGLLHFEDFLQGQSIAIFSDNTTALSYLLRQGGTRSWSLNIEAQAILEWAEQRAVTLTTQFIRGSANVLADSLSRRSQIISTEWTLHQEVCNSLWRLNGRPLIDLFSTRLNYRIPTFISPFQDPMALVVDAFLFNWDHLHLYAFPPFAVIRRVLNKLLDSRGTTLLLIAPFWPQKEWFPDLLRLVSDTPRLIPPRRDLLRQPHVHRFYHAPHALRLTAWTLSSDSCATRVIPDGLRNSWRELSGIPLL